MVADYETIKPVASVLLAVVAIARKSLPSFHRGRQLVTPFTCKQKHSRIRGQSRAVEPKRGAEW